jgi:hypothetical protein
MRGPEEPDPTLIAAMVKQAAATAR